MKLYNIKHTMTTSMRQNKLPLCVLIFLRSLDNIVTWRGLVKGFTEKNIVYQFADNNIGLITLISWLAVIGFVVILSMVPKVWMIKNTHIYWVFNVFYAVIIGGNMNALSLYNKGLILPF